jgi:hypothetical protein
MFDSDMLFYLMYLNSINKEQAAYAKEAETQQKRIDKLIAEGADEADVRKQVYYIKVELG